VYKLAYLEISGICNAKCPWCTTGNRSLESSYPSGFIAVGDFEKAIVRLLALDLIGPATCLELFIWGEPLLHPDFNGILRVLNKYHINFGISTNASKCVEIEDGLSTTMKYLTISMPGFSQTSYDRIHGFEFDRILRNIDILLKNFKKAGYAGTAKIAYHIYQFNIGEIPAAMDFCFRKKIRFMPSAAYLCDFNLAMSYLDNSVDYEELKGISKDLLLYYVDDLIASSPKDYACPQYDFLAINEKCEVITCCGISKDNADYSVGNLFALSAEEIRKGKLSKKVCAKCLSCGLAYWMHNPDVPEFLDYMKLGQNRKQSHKLLPYIKRNIPSLLKSLVKGSYSWLRKRR